MTASADCIMVFKTWTGQGQKSPREHPAWCLVSAHYWPEPRGCPGEHTIRGLGALKWGLSTARRFPTRTLHFKKTPSNVPFPLWLALMCLMSDKKQDNSVFSHA